MTLPTDIKAASAQSPLQAYRGASQTRSPRALVTANSTAVVRSIERNSDAAITRQSPGSSAEANLSSLQAQAVRAMRDYVFAALDYAETLREGAPTWATAEVASLRRQGLSASERLDDFIEAADRVASLLRRRPSRLPLTFAHVAPMAETPDDGQDAPAQCDALTLRECDVLELLLRGLPNKLIARELGIAEATTKAHISAILRKLNVSSRGRVIALLANVDSAAKANLRVKG
jgi:DNA-binding CsgD family transcriptional regulator